MTLSSTACLKFPHHSVPVWIAPSEASDLTQWMRLSLGRLKAAGLKVCAGIGPPERWAVDGPSIALLVNQIAEALLMYDSKESGSAEALLMYAPKSGAEKRKAYFREYIADRHVCELFGSGFLPDPCFSPPLTMTGVRFGPCKLEGNERDALQMPLSEVCGDIFHPNTWARLREEMQSRGIPAMDFMYMRPVAGWNQLLSGSVEHTADALGYIIANVIQILHPEGGKFAFELMLDVSEDVNQNPAMVHLVSTINRLSTYELHLFNDYTEGLPFLQLWGVLAPKEQGICF